MERIAREVLGQELRRFDIEFSDRMVQHALTGTGLKPTYEGTPGKRGKISKHDPLDAWVIATAEYGRKAAWSDDSIRLDQLEDLYAHVCKLKDASHIEGFTEDAQLGMRLLYITRWQYGFPFEDLVRVLGKDPKLYELSTFDPGYMRIVLQAYRMVLGRFIEGWALPMYDEETASQSDKTELQFAEAWVEQAATLFRLASTPAVEHEGGDA